MSQLGQLLFNGIKSDEGFRGYIYDDKTGNRISIGTTLEGEPTVGYGFAFNRWPMSEKQAVSILLDRCIDVEIWCENNLKYWNDISPFRKYAIANIVYQVGGEGWLGFVKANYYIAQKDFDSASVEIMDSDYAREAPNRAARMAVIIKTDQMNGQTLA